MFRKTCGRHRKLPIRTTTQRGNGGRSSAAARENLRELFGRGHLALSIGTIAGFFVEAPAAELRHVAKARALQMLVGHGDDEFRPNRLPGQIFAMTPAAL